MTEKTYPQMVGDLVARWLAGPPSLAPDAKRWAGELIGEARDLATNYPTSAQARAVLAVVELSPRGIVDPPNPGVSDPPPNPDRASDLDPPPDPGIGPRGVDVPPNPGFGSTPPDPG